MKFTVRELLISCAVAASLLLASAADARTETTVVAQLYKTFAWEALVGIVPPDQAQAFKPLAEESESVLGQYFSPELTALLVADKKCKVRSREICKLDFVLLFASQDPAAMDLSIERAAPGVVKVMFTFPSTREKIELKYKLARIRGDWRITDITYPSLGDASLVKILRVPLP